MDSVFYLDSTKNDFAIYISRGEWQPFSYYMAKGKMLIRGKKLYDIDSTGKIEFAFPWKKHKTGCGYIKETNGA